MSNNPLVTVAIPTYKGVFLRNAIDSVLNQDYKNLELIIVNDQSPEDIGSIVKSYNDERIKYYVNESNIGGKDLVASWDRCLSYASGEFFCLLCDDDVYKPQLISTLLSLSYTYRECNVFRARCELIDIKGNVSELYPSCPCYETSYDYMYHVFKGLRRQTISEFMYRTEHIRKCGGYVHFPIAWHSDYWSTFNISREGGIASTNKVLVTFRMSGENISSKLNKYGIEKAKANMMAYKTALDYIENAEDVLRTLLIKELDIWKVRTDRKMLNALSFKEKMEVFIHRNDFGMPMCTLIRSLFVSIIVKLYK